MDYSKLAGLIPAVIQDADSAEVLMVGFMNEAALELTRTTGFATFFSRSRNKMWMKGETSGNRLQVVDLLVDCDDDTVLVKVKRLGDGNVCHTGERTCFFRTLKEHQGHKETAPEHTPGINRPRAVWRAPRSGDRRGTDRSADRL